MDLSDLFSRLDSMIGSDGNTGANSSAGSNFRGSHVQGVGNRSGRESSGGCNRGRMSSRGGNRGRDSSGGGNRGRMSSGGGNRGIESSGGGNRGRESSGGGNKGGRGGSDNRQTWRSTSSNSMSSENPRWGNQASSQRNRSNSQSRPFSRNSDNGLPRSSPRPYASNSDLVNGLPIENSPKSGKSAKLYYFKFGFKKIDEMVREQDSDEIILYICNNADFFELLLKEKPRTDLLYLLMRLIVKTIDTKFRESKLVVYSMICEKEFIEFLIIHLTGFLTETDGRRIKSGHDFLKNLGLFFKDFISLLPTKAIESIDNLLTISMMVVNNLCSRHGEFTELFKEFDKLRGELDLIKERWEQNEKDHKKNKKRMVDEPPNDFRELSLYPTSQDLKERNFLRENIIDGSYEDALHYMDIQFRLLREDFIDPLRMGIRDYKESLTSVDRTRKRNFNVRIYRNVRFVGIHYDTKRPGELAYTVQLEAKFASKVRWEYSKRLLFNSLCLFSRNDFETFQLATVSDRNFDDLKKGLVNVVLVGENIFGNELCTMNFTMAESSAFFEPVYQTLNALINMPVDKLPMENYLLVKDITPKYPKYFQNRMHIEVKNRLIDIRDDNSWLTCHDLGFNESQCRALKSAIRNEFVVIQGPPGTGKTYLGLNLVEILLKNFKFDSPILMVCYTNHALDQFLEGLLSVTTDIIRIGGQSKNEALNNFNYQNIRKKHRISRHPSIHTLRNDMSDSLNKIASCNKLMSGIQQCVGILNILEYKEYLRGIDIFENTNDYLSWLLGDMYGTLTFLLHKYKQDSKSRIQQRRKKEEPGLSNGQELDENEEDIQRRQYFDAFNDEEEIELLSQVQGEVSYSLTLNKLQMVMQSLQEHLFDLNSINAPNEVKQVVINDLSAIQQIDIAVSSRLNMPNAKPSKKFSDLLNKNLWGLSDDDKWALYHYWVRDIHKNVSRSMSELHEKYSNALNTWREIKVMEDYSTLRDLKPKILGLTTTGAARHHSLLNVLKPAVIIVEEAAEVLEAHILVSLTESCQHLILIGDHKQLRPNPSTFKLAKDYHLDISLFERMLRNGVGCTTLNVQHRMKPNIASLIVPTIYSELMNHDSVHHFPPVLGVAKNLFFIDHCEPEMKDNDMESQYNPHEATFMIALCRHLILQGYKPSDITILTTYSSQQFTLRDLKKKDSFLREVRMTVVDNYQGEECKIILLSLVRSNSEGKIGFVGIENRICVALSRAKHGLYIMGDMKLFKSKSEIWAKINSTLEKDNAIGESLSLVCQIHKEVTPVKCAKDFDKVMEGGCSLQCLRMMSCGHTCHALCHVVDIDHAKFKCYQPCNREICDEDGHVCPLRCYQACKPCAVLMKRKLPQCGHEAIIQCHVNPAEYKCKIIVKDIKADCKHEVERHCFQNIDHVKCQTPCEIRLECGHACTRKCHVKNDPEHQDFKCMKNCTKLNADCQLSHPCQRRCWEECKQCVVKVQRTLECGHTHKIDCSMEISEFVCVRGCNRIMACGHKCRLKCCEPCGDCKQLVDKIIPDCGHNIKIECSQKPTYKMCKRACERKLSCGHGCKLKCSQECSLYKCKEYIPSPVKPSCGHPGQVLCSDASKFTDPTSDLLLKYCREPCRKQLPCKDICSGTCGQCMQGRIHQVCQEKCGNILICGHSCTVPCREDCPPCKETCLYKCQHSKCGKRCGTPCTPCKEPCSWICKHLSCTKLCGEECDREPCYEPCDMKLECGHPCVGFCGEPCPPLCRICHQEELTEIFFGNEDEEDARFVYLHDCKHTMESEGLESWLNMKVEDGKDQIIGIKGCPKCKTPITGTLRFSNASKKAFKQVQEVKSKIFGRNDEIRDLHKQLLDVHIPNIDRLINSSQSFVVECNDLIEVISHITRCSRNLTITSGNRNRGNQRGKSSKNELKLLNFVCLYLVQLLETCLKVVYNSSNPFVSEFHKKITIRFYLLVSHLARRKYKISLMEIQQFQSELDRFKRMVEFYNILMDCIKNGKLKNTRAVESAKKIINDFFSIQPYNYDGKMIKCIEEFSKISDVFYEAVTPEEMRMVHKAMIKDFTSASKQGHWFKCSNGHVYVITECGGAMEKGVCPECKESIGGGNHSLVKSSRLASEMDGAQYAAWSDQQNMANYLF